MTTAGLAARAEVVLDPRLAEVWQLIWAGEADPAGRATPVSEEVLAGLLRLAYMQGYADAMAVPDAGALYRELGVRDPSIKRTESRRPRGARRRPGSSDR